MTHLAAGTRDRVLLAVSTTAPWPVGDGYTLRVFNLLQELSRFWRIKLLAPPPAAGAAPFPEQVAEYVPLTLKGPGLAYPWRFDQAPLREAVADAVARFRPERALVWRGGEALRFDAPGFPPAVIDVIDCVPLDLWRGILTQQNTRRRLGMLRELGTATRYSRRAVRHFAATICAGESDRAWLRWIGGRRTVHAIPNGVHLPEPAGPPGRESAGAFEALAPAPTLSFIGSLNFEPNIDAVTYLAEAIWPKVRAAVPDAQLVPAGRNPTPEVAALAQRPGISLLADVPDMTPVLRASWASIAPMRAGVGVKNKVLESWACARPAVLTPLAANGLDVPEGHAPLVQATADGLAAAAVSLLTSRDEVRRLGEEAQRHAATSCSWQSVAARVHALLQEAAPRARRALDDGVLADRPTLFVVIDTEAEFDWSAGFARNLTSVSAISAVHRGQEILDRHGLRPVYVIDYPVATSPDGYGPLRAIAERGACAIGAHLHPWTTPPFEEPVSEVTSFAGNLPPDLEERKLRTLVAAIERSFGITPRFFKAGRYGVGRSTLELVARLGIKVDFSIMPGLDMRRRGGPEFLDYAAVPYLVDGVFSLPMTRGHVGLLADAPAGLVRALDGTLARDLHLPALLVRTGLLNRVTLTPEGVTAEEQIALIRRLVAQGKRVFVLHYHSPSLMAGKTPYARTEQDVTVLLDRLERVCRFFMDEIGGVPGDPDHLAAVAQRLIGAEAESPVPVPAGPIPA
jgi:glycosyltransferase involved in cell wall biosynthesis